jgi:hypothetical protein
MKLSNLSLLLVRAGQEEVRREGKGREGKGREGREVKGREGECLSV